MARSITFVVDGDVDTQVTVTEVADGTLRFDLNVLGAGLIGDLRGLFFDLADPDGAPTLNLSTLSIEGETLVDGHISNPSKLVGNTKFEEAAVDTVGRDANMKGKILHDYGRYDAGIEFGMPGMAKDDIQAVSFTLSSSAGDLSLDMLDLTDFGLRYTSVGEEDGPRDDSLKIGDVSSGVARNDAFEVDENDEGTEDLLANDTNGTQVDGTRKTVIFVTDADGALTATAGGFERTVVIDGLELGTLTVSDDGYATFVADGADVDKLGHDAIKTWAFTYVTEATDGSLATADVELTIDGQNDQPVAEDLFLTVDEDDGSSPFTPSLTGDGVTASFVASDIDIGDTLSYQIISAPTDSEGHLYGEVINNGDGTFTFNPLDNFQFLGDGETRDVTFEYVAIDDSGAGLSPNWPEEVDTSEAKTVTVTVVGSDDAPTETAGDLLFVTEDQSMFGTGDAIVFDDPLPFFGLDEWFSLDATIIPGYTFSGAVLEGILEGIEAVADFFVDVGCEIASWFGGDCDDVDVDLPSSISTPSIGTSGYLDAKVGLQPYFELTTGDVDATVPVDVVFTAPYQVEEGDTFTIGSSYSIDGAEFTTASPNVSFGLDFVFDIAADLDFDIGSSTFGGGYSFGIFDFDTADISDFEGELGEPGFNIFNFDAEDDLEFEVGLPLGSTLSANFPLINTDSNDAPNPSSEVLTSTGEDDIAVLDVDVDALVSALPYIPPLGDSGSEGLSIDIAGASVNLVSFDWAWDVVAVNLINTLKVVQDFTMTIDELPLLASFEDGSVISGLKVGDDLTVTAPDELVFDPEVDGDADGVLDFDIDVDMGAIFENLTTLGFDMDLFVGLLRLTGGISSDFFSDTSFSLFPGGEPGTADDFLWSDTFELIDDYTLATLFDDDFALTGFEGNPHTVDTVNGYYDIA
ncbi:VCBS domain-containing protein [Antarcticimicrobium luteum]|uniref:RapA2 cadherin-like domain-containing protein n=1 Tax=Antarcticimicrobium luteum TaxID=2547397 RepID=A0A4R5VC73_9RHOB|nr:Ig-like domain-containing protein [Antarcticimicrobium luteum]TDK49701.1 hypothetical protein E1832_08920 [Antarcticimicrobium luteum]